MDDDHCRLPSGDGKRFAGQTVVITGGATGIGYATAELFAKEGAHIVIASLPQADADAIVQRLRTYGGQAWFIPADVADEQAVIHMVEETVRLSGRLDILVNNAAMFYESDFLQADSQHWRTVFNVIVDGAYFCTKYAAPIMAQTGGGAIVNVSSINGSRALPMSSHYNAAKGALDQLTRCTALELAPLNIRVNSVAPGFIDTALSLIGGINELETTEFQAYYVRQRRIPLARAGLPHEVAQAIAFLASAQASYIHGAILPVDGGLANSF